MTSEEFDTLKDLIETVGDYVVKGFKETNERFNIVNARLDVLESDMAIMRQDVNFIAHALDDITFYSDHKKLERRVARLERQFPTKKA